MIELKFEKYAILSLVGRHAGESFSEIIERKQDDIEIVGYTFWLENSFKTYPDKVQSFYGLVRKNGIDLNCLLYSSDTAQDTKKNSKAIEYSVDKKNWLKIDSRLTPVTGNLTKNSHALVFDKLDLVKDVEINLKNYVEFDTGEPIRNYPNASTFCVIKKFDNVESKNTRKIFAVGRIHKPSSVWIR